jgi:hypothetical protein
VTVIFPCSRGERSIRLKEFAATAVRSRSRDSGREVDGAG